MEKKERKSFYVAKKREKISYVERFKKQFSQLILCSFPVAMQYHGPPVC